MNIGLLGFGVVGRGVYDMLAGRDDIRAVWVLCRRDLGELTARTTYEMQDILDDPAVDTVVEVMGGLHPAYEYVAAALRAGKNVVSSNKYLMCRYYDELTALANEHGAALRCTAAVGGGIPWLTNLEKAAHANHISRVWGILNGTTNYIMDAMHGSDADFADVLAQAQALGYAEADPSADIDGLDIQRKLILSANVAFGVSLREAKSRLWEQGFNVGAVVFDEGIDLLNQKDARVYGQQPVQGYATVVGSEVGLRLTLDAEKVARESAASDKQAQALSEERERRRAELADSLAEAEVRRHAEELQRGAGTANAEEDNFF